MSSLLDEEATAAAQVLSELDSLCYQLYTSSDQRNRIQSDRSLVFLIGRTLGMTDAEIAAHPRANESSHAFAALPQALPLHSLVLKSTSVSMYAHVFSSGSTMLCIDNHFSQLNEMARLATSDFLLSYLVHAANSSLPLAAYNSAAKAWCRLASLSFAFEHQHVIKGMTVLLLDSTSSRKLMLGLTVFEQLVRDVQQPHSLVLDSSPTIRILMFREVVLRPVTARVAAVLQECFNAVLDALGESQVLRSLQAGLSSVPFVSPRLKQLLDAGSTHSVAAQSVAQALIDALQMSRRALDLFEAILTFDFSSARARASSSSTNEDEDSADTIDDDVSIHQLPMTWVLFRQASVVAIPFAIFKLCCALFQSIPDNLVLSAAKDAILQCGSCSIKVCSQFAGSASMTWRQSHLRTNRSMCMRTATAAMAICCFSAERSVLIENGWLHETARLLLRMKLTFPLAEIANGCVENSVEFLQMLAHFTYECFGARFNTTTTQSSSSSHHSLLHLPPLSVSRNTLDIVLAVWALLLMPAPNLPINSPVSSLLRSFVKPLRHCIFSRFVGNPPFASSSLSSSVTTAPPPEDSDDNDEDALVRLSTSAFETLADDTIDLCAEVTKYDLSSCVSEVTLAIDQVNEIMEDACASSSSLPLSDRTAILGRAQKSLSWLVRFSSPLAGMACKLGHGEGEARDFEELVLGRIPPPSTQLSLESAFVTEAASNIANTILSDLVAWASDHRQAAVSAALGLAVISQSQSDQMLANSSAETARMSAASFPSNETINRMMTSMTLHSNSSAKFSDAMALASSHSSTSDSNNFAMGGVTASSSSSGSAVGNVTDSFSRAKISAAVDEFSNSDFGIGMGASARLKVNNLLGLLGLGQPRDKDEDKPQHQQGQHQHDQHPNTGESGGGRSSQAAASESLLTSTLGDPSGDILYELLAFGCTNSDRLFRARERSSKMVPATTSIKSPFLDLHPSGMTTTGFRDGGNSASNTSYNVSWALSGEVLSLLSMRRSSTTIAMKIPPPKRFRDSASEMSLRKKRGGLALNEYDDVDNDNDEEDVEEEVSFLSDQQQSSPTIVSKTSSESGEGIGIGEESDHSSSEGQLPEDLLAQYAAMLRPEKEIVPLLASIFRSVAFMRSQAIKLNHTIMTERAAASKQYAENLSGRNAAMQGSVAQYLKEGKSSLAASYSTSVLKTMADEKSAHAARMDRISSPSYLAPGGSLALHSYQSGATSNSSGLYASPVPTTNTNVSAGISGDISTFVLGLTEKDESSSLLSDIDSVGLKLSTSLSLDPQNIKQDRFTLPSFFTSSSSSSSSSSTLSSPPPLPPPPPTLSSPIDASPVIALMWTSQRCSLELSFIHFFSFFHTLFCSYRGDAETVLKARRPRRKGKVASMEEGDESGAGREGEGKRMWTGSASNNLPFGITFHPYTMVGGRLMPSSRAQEEELDGDGEERRGTDLDSHVFDEDDDDGLFEQEMPPLSVVSSSDMRSSRVPEDPFAFTDDDSHSRRRSNPPPSRHAGPFSRLNHAGYDLRRHLDDLADRNVILQLMKLTYDSNPHHLLDVIVAKILDNLCLGADCPTSVVDSSLRCLHELSLGVTLVVKSAGYFGSTQTPVEVGSDILKTLSVQALLRRPSEIVFPCLSRLQKHARYRSMIYSTITRLLFLNAKAVTRPEAELMKKREKIKGDDVFGAGGVNASTSSSSTLSSHSERGLRLADSLLREARESRLQAESKGPQYESSAKRWKEVEDAANAVIANSAYLEDEDNDDPEKYIYIFSPGAGGVNDRTSWFNTFVQPITANMEKLYTCLKDPRRMPLTFGSDALLKLALIGTLRDIRGVLSAANTSNEFKLSHDWLLQSGAPDLLRYTASQLPLEGNVDVIIPLLRVLIEYGTNRLSRIIFPPENAGGLKVVAFVASCTVALMRSALTCVSIQAQKGGAVGPDLQKILRLCLVAAHRVLVGRICNFSVMAAFGDSSVLDLWPASIACIASLPVSAMGHDVKISETVFEMVHALTSSPYPQSGILRTMQSASPSFSPYSSTGLDSTMIQHPESILAFLRLSGRKLFLDVIERAVKGLQGSQGKSSSSSGRGNIASGRISHHALEFFENLLTLEADARLLKQDMMTLSSSGPDRLNALFAQKGLTSATATEMPSTPAAIRRALFTRPSGIKMLFSEALEIVSLMDEYVNTSSSSSSSSNDYRKGIFGDDFTTLILLSGARSCAKETQDSLIDAWQLSRIALVNAISRPQSFEAALAGVAVSCSVEGVQEVVSEECRTLLDVVQRISEPTSTETKDEFSRSFLDFAKVIGKAL